MGEMAIIVTGLPASGKTSVARVLADSLKLLLFDKDDFLERLYDEQGVSDWDARKRQSRASDQNFRAAATQANSAILVSHWRPNNPSTESGTATDWLKPAFDNIVEVYCECHPTIATQRFLARQRHPGHLDSQRDPVQLARQMVSFMDGYPLGLGKVVRVNTERKVNIERLLAQLAPYCTV